MNYNTTMTLGKVLSGISKTLGVANQVIPLFQQTKPLIKNVRTAYGLFKNNNKSILNEPKAMKNTVVNNHKPKEKTITYSNNSPQFFI